MLACNLIVFGDVENYGYWAWTSSTDIESKKSEFKLAYLIVILISMKGGNNLLDDGCKFI